MIKHVMQSKLTTGKAMDFFNFMVNPQPDVYAKWIPEEHYKFQVVKRSDKSPVGDLFYFDQNIGGKHRMKFNAIIRLADEPRHVLFQIRKFGINLPGYVELKFEDSVDGMLLTEEMCIGFEGFGGILDHFIRIVYNKSFFKEMDEHHKREWQRLADVFNENTKL